MPSTFAIIKFLINKKPAIPFEINVAGAHLKFSANVLFI